MSRGHSDTIVVRATSYVVTATAVVAGIVLVVLMVMTTADVAGRYLFNAPILGVFDLTHFAVLIMTFFGFAYCAMHGAHVTIELLYGRFGPTTRTVLTRLTNLAGAALFAVIAWRSIIVSFDAKEFRMASQLMLIPHWPFYYVLAYGAALFAWVLLLQVFYPLPDNGHHGEAP